MNKFAHFRWLEHSYISKLSTRFKSIIIELNSNTNSSMDKPIHLVKLPFIILLMSIMRVHHHILLLTLMTLPMNSINVDKRYYGYFLLERETMKEASNELFQCDIGNSICEEGTHWPRFPFSLGATF